MQDTPPEYIKKQFEILVSMPQRKLYGKEWE